MKGFFSLLCFPIGFVGIKQLLLYTDLVPSTFVKNALLFLIDFPLSLLRFCIWIITNSVNDDSL